MTDVDLAFERFVATNPVTDPDRLVADLDLEADTFDIPGAELAARRRSSHARRPWASAAAIWMVALAAIALFSARPGREAATGETAIGVVETFFARWNAGDSAAAMALVDIGVSVNYGSQSWSDVQSLMQWSMEFDGRMEVECSSSGDDGDLAICEWAFVTAATEALEIDPAPRRRFEVADGRIVSITTPNYGALEKELAEHARRADPGGFAQECTVDSGVASSLYGFPFTTRCGRFLAALEADVVAELES